MTPTDTTRARLEARSQFLGHLLAGLHAAVEDFGALVDQALTVDDALALHDYALGLQQKFHGLDLRCIRRALTLAEPSLQEVR